MSAKELKIELEKLLADKINPIGQLYSPKQIADQIIELLNNRIDNFDRKIKFVKPTIQDLENYLIENNLAGNKSIAEIGDLVKDFYDHYESVGWTVGKAKKPMVSWKKSLDGWVRRNKQFNKGKDAKVDESIQAYIGIQKLKQNK
jgi:hypothetical protein